MIMASVDVDRVSIEGLQRRDPDAVATLLERTWRRGYLLALRLTGDEATAADVTQEACVQALRAAPRFDAARPFAPWFLRIVTNEALGQARGRARRRAREERVARREGVDAGPIDPGRDLAPHLQRLEPDVRAALCLKYVDGMTFSDVAATLGCPEGTAASRVRRGLEQLRASLGRDPAAVLAVLALAESPRAPSVSTILAGAARARGVLAGATMSWLLLAGAVAAIVAVAIVPLVVPTTPPLAPVVATSTTNEDAAATDPMPREPRLPGAPAPGADEPRSASNAPDGPPPPATTGGAAPPAALPEEIAWRQGDWSLSGTVTDRLGRAVAGASVTVAPEGKINATTAAVASTDAVGFYAFRGLPAGGAFTIGVHADRFAPHDIRLVPAGPAVRHDVVLAASRALTVTLTDEDGRPWQGPVECALTRVEGTTQRTSIERLVSDARGRVRLEEELREDEPLGALSLGVRVQDRVPAIVRDLAVFARPGSDVDVELTLSRGATFQGLVVEADGAAAAGADVWLTPAGDPDWLSVFAHVRADASGRFSTSGLEDGQYLAFSRSARGILAAPVPVVVTAGMPTDARLQQTDRTGTITGTVVRPDGTPVSDVDLELQPSRTLPGVHGRRLRTDAAGRFTFAGLSLDAARYRLTVGASTGLVVERPVVTSERVELVLVATFPDPSFRGQTVAASVEVAFAR